jgi:two-component system NarL family response regulator
VTRPTSPTYEIIGLRRDFLPEEVWHDDPIRILLCDDHALHRRGLLVVLEEEPDVEVLGEADTGPEAASLAEVLAPDVVLLDVRLPPYGGVAAAAQISRAVPSARIIVLAANARRPLELLEALGAGAMSVMLKERSLDDATSVIRRAARGDCVLLPPVARAAQELIDGQLAHPVAGLPPIDVTDRERLVLEIVARGADAADAATGLGVDEATAVNLLRNLLLKLQRYWRAEDAAVSFSTPRVADEADVALITRVNRWVRQEID